MRILIVEDDPKIRAYVEKGLKEAGHAVDAAEDGELLHALVVGGADEAADDALRDAFGEELTADVLLRGAERVEGTFARAQMLDQVWGGNVYVEDRTIDVHIRRLRKALEPFGYDRFIQTVRGTGYRFSLKADKQDIV